MSGVCVARRAPFAKSRIEPDIEPDHGAGKIPRRERRQIVDALADTDEMPRHFELLCDGDQNAAARGAIELGHDEAGDADDLAENLDLRQRVLADGGVEHEQHGMRRRRLDLLHHPHHLFQLAHQFGTVLQTAGGVDQRHVDALLFGRHDCVVYQAGSVGAGFARDERSAAALGPDLELIDGRGAKRIARRQHHRAAFGAQFRRELADSRGLAGAVDAGDQDDERFYRRIDGQRLRHAAEHFLHLRRHRRLDFVRRNRRVEAPVTQLGGDPVRGLRAEIGTDQLVLDLVDGRRVELALCHHVRDGAAERRRAALEPAGEALPPIARCFRRAVVHQAPVIAVSAMYATMTPEQMVSRLLYRDGLMLVIDKPAGLAVHRGPNGGESVEDHFDALRFGLPRAPALAHRLDRDTSGCLVLGRHRKALAQLGKLFKNGAIDKTYWAVVEGAPDADEGEIALPLGRLDVTRGWWMKHDPQGQPAVTRWKVMGSPPPCGGGVGGGGGVVVWAWGGGGGGGGGGLVAWSGTPIDASRNFTTPTPAPPHK